MLFRRRNRYLIGFVVFILLFIFFSISKAQDKQLRFEHLTVEDGLAQSSVFSIIKDKYGFVWFATWAGLCRYDGYKNIIYRTDSTDPLSIINNRIESLILDNNSNIWISFIDTSLICRYNYYSDNFTRFDYNEVNEIIRDSLDRFFNSSEMSILKNNYLWNLNKWTFPDVYFISSLKQTNLQTKNVKTYQYDPADRWGLNDNMVNNIFIDNQDILWVGTYGHGVNKADLLFKEFRCYHHSANKNSIIDDYAKVIYEDPYQNLWVGSQNKGITEIIKKDNSYIYYMHQKTNSNSLCNNQIRAIYRDRYGYMWFGTKSGLDKYDSVNKKYYHYSTKSKNKIPDNWVYTIIEDRHGVLWIGTFNGFASYDRINDKFNAYNSSVALRHPRILTMHVDDANYLWIGTIGGGMTRVIQHTLANGKINLNYKHYLFSKNDANRNRIYGITEDEYGKLWLATSGGVICFDKKSETFKNLSQANGLSDDMILSIESDRNGSVWCSHNKGISRIYIRNDSIRNFSLEDGLVSTDFAEKSSFRLKSGELLFGSPNGITAFFPAKIKDNPYYPKIVFTGLHIDNKDIHINKKYNGRVILSKPLYLTKEIKLLHSDVSIGIEFAGLHYSNPLKNRYTYILEGFDKEWINTDASNRLVYYSNLKPGTYTFKVKASNCDGLWNPVPATLRIVVLPPFWGTWWFKFLEGLMLLVLLYFIYYLRLAYYQKRQKQLKILVKHRTKELELSTAKSLEQSKELRIVNEQLLERHKFIEQQSFELTTYSDNLKEINILLQEEQQIVKKQAIILQENNLQLSLLNTTKDKLFSILAHDLKVPFNSLLGFSELLLNNMDKYPADKIKTQVKYIRDAANMAYELLENLLHWSRMQRGVIEFVPELIDMKQFLESCLRIPRQQALQKEISVSILIYGIEKLVEVDTIMFSTIIRNLVSNAIKYSHKSSTVQLDVFFENNKLSIEVIDHGVGIEDDLKDKLFQINDMVSIPGTANEKGTGLGLVVCADFIARHRGKIWVESEFGKGSIFKFYIPIENLDTIS